MMKLLRTKCVIYFQVHGPHEFNYISSLRPVGFLQKAAYFREGFSGRTVQQGNLYVRRCSTGYTLIVYKESFKLTRK